MRHARESEQIKDLTSTWYFNGEKGYRFVYKETLENSINKLGT